LRHERLTEEGQETAALYALGALSQNEARAFEAHLHQGCTVCQQQLDEFACVTGTLGESVERVAPPSYLRDLLKVRIEKESESLSQSTSDRASIIPFPDKQSATGSAASGPRASKGRVWIPWAVAASLLVGLLVSLLVWQSDRRNLQASINQSKNETLAAVKENKEIKESLSKQSARGEELAQINAILASPDQYQRFTLKATENAPEAVSAATGTVYWNKRDKKWVVTADLPQPPEGKAYQLWFVTAGAPVSAGMIRPDDTGHGFLVTDVPSGVQTVVAAAITLEPSGGSPQPTMPIIAMGKAG